MQLFSMKTEEWAFRYVFHSAGGNHKAMLILSKTMGGTLVV